MLSSSAWLRDEPRQIRGGRNATVGYRDIPATSGNPIWKNVPAIKPDPSSQLKHESKSAKGGRRFLTGSQFGCRLAASDPTAGFPSPDSAQGRCCALVSAGTAALPPPSPLPSPPPTWRRRSSCPSLRQAIAAKPARDSTGSTSWKANGTLRQRCPPAGS